MVVDEISLGAWKPAELERPSSPSARTAVVVGEGAWGSPVEAELRARGIEVFRGADAGALAERLATALPLGGADLAVVASREIDAVIRPRRGHERGLVRPRGTICITDVGQPRDALLVAVLGKGLRLTTSRCGDLRAAVQTLADQRMCLGETLGERLVTDVVPALDLEEAFVRAAGSDSVKVVATQGHGKLSRIRPSG
jgi:hypothetical protein